MGQDPGFTEISREECLQLLSERSLGRLGVIDEGRPLIFPVNYALDGEAILFRTDPGLKLRRTPLRQVAFEVDDVDLETGTAWSVLVQGHAFEITRAIDRRSEARRRLSVSPLAPGEKHHWLQIEADEITGRRLRLPTPDGAALVGDSGE
jgi:nitroimidazol reductase NimA-like FMN-containing flavoprotein (pyridoxamine 5'-phosphate oxidase superfamily)